MKRSDCSVLFAEFPADHRSAAPLSRQDSGGIDCHQSGRIRRSGRTGWQDDRARSGRQDSAIEEACLDQAGAHPIRSGSIMPVGKPDPDTPPPLPPFDRVESHLLELLGLATRPFLLRMQESSAFLMVLCACRTVVHASSIWRAAMRLKKLIDKRVFPV